MEDEYDFNGIDIEEVFEGLELAGSGSFGSATKVKFKNPNHRGIPKDNPGIYCLKCIIKEGKEDKKVKKSFQRESKILKKMNNENLLKCYATFEDKDGDYYILTNYAESGNLKSYITKRKGVTNSVGKLMYKKDDTVNKMIECMNGLAYLHERNLVHRDIKPENIFLTNDPKIVIGDFGLCCLITKDGEINDFDPDIQLIKGNFAGTPGYVAPEVQFREDYNQLCDIFSMGVTFYEWCFNYEPRYYIEELNEKVFKYEMFLADVAQSFIRDRYYPSELKDLIWDMLSLYPPNRPSAELCKKKLEEILKSISK